jgi:Fe2+ or Zn2+ uptake regulation protein
MGEVSEARLGRGAALFDVNVAPHYHCICDECGRIADVPATDAGCCLQLPELAACGCIAETVEIIFHGHCAGCVPRQ